MTDTVNLGLPCIEGSQAQKHVTHNDALRILDTLVQLAVLDRDLSAPPGSPSEGQRWIVKSAGTGAWAGHDNAVAAWQDGAWQFSAPQTGWCAFVVDEGALLIWNGTAWSDFISSISLQNLPLLGVGTTADSTNPLSAKLNNTLFAAKSVAEGGSGDLRYKLSKSAAGNTASFLFQDNYSGRAEIGLIGDDDFHFKVSPDGSTWVEGLKIAAATGKVSFPASGGPREMLAANRTYYVRTDGSDANNGLANSSGGAFVTVQHAINVIASTLDLAGYTVTIQVLDGTYTGNIVVSDPWTGGGNVLLQGNTTTPTNCILAPTSGVAVAVGSPVSTSNISSSPKLLIAGFNITTTNAAALQASDGARINIVGNMNFGATGTGSHLATIRNGAIFVSSNYTISGNAASHFAPATQGNITCNSKTITLSGSPVFSSGFASAGRMGMLVSSGCTFSGSTGSSSKRYAVATLSLIDTSGGGASYFPGDTAGTNDGTGIYN